MWSFITQYWAEWIFGIVTAALGMGYRKLTKKIKVQQTEAKAIKDGLLAILHDRLYQSCTYYLAQGHTNADALKNVEYMYNAYHSLGGNGTGTTLYEKLKALPIKDD